MRSATCAIGAAIVSLSGCAIQLGSLSVVADKNIDFAHKKKVLVKSGVEGRDMNDQIICLFRIQGSSIDRAVYNAVQSAGGDYMENVKMQQYMWYIPYIYGRMGFKIKGDVYKLVDDSTCSK
jgi:hypothetical protein